MMIFTDSKTRCEDRRHLRTEVNQGATTTMFSPKLMIALAAVPIMALATAAGTGAQDKKQTTAGWPGIFPEMNGYSRSYKPPIVEGDKKNPVYRQSAEYVWTGGADRHLTVTVARDAKFKKLYSAEEVKKTKPAPEKIDIAKHEAWLWKFERDMKDVRPLHARLVVLLEGDRVLIVELSGFGPFANDAEAVVGKIDLGRLKKTLDNPPVITGEK
jgi:hypothetical protein